MAVKQCLCVCAVTGRYTIVLQIFNLRARTKEAKLQVALAELPYLRYFYHAILCLSNSVCFLLIMIIHMETYHQLRTV